MHSWFLPLSPGISGAAVPLAFPGEYRRGHRMAVADRGSARTHGGARETTGCTPPCSGKCHTGLTRVSTYRGVEFVLAFLLVGFPVGGRTRPAHHTALLAARGGPYRPRGGPRGVASRRRWQGRLRA